MTHRKEQIMSRKWYGSLNNRIDENKMFCDEIKVGTGMTEYSWSDRHAYEVIAVRDQKHVTVREYDHKRPDDEKDYSYTNHWVLVSNENNPEIEMVKRGNYWYTAVSIEPDRAREILVNGTIDERLWACHCGFDLQAIVDKGKKATKYHKKNVSFGVAEYYYDYEF